MSKKTELNDIIMNAIITVSEKKEYFVNIPKK